MIKQVDLNVSNVSIESDAYYNTREVAQMLGLSLGTVQKMVEQGVLQAWKTSGGHRRILGSSVEDFLKNHQPNTFAEQSNRLSILVIENDPSGQKHYQSFTKESNMPINLTVVGSGLAGLIQMAKHCPDILIIDLPVPDMDGFEIINTIRKDHWFDMMDIIIATELELNKTDINGKKQLPKGVTAFNKPIPTNILLGYISAKLASL